jgi:hypothetical protein
LWSHQEKDSNLQEHFDMMFQIQAIIHEKLFLYQEAFYEDVVNKPLFENG